MFMYLTVLRFLLRCPLKTNEIKMQMYRLLCGAFTCAVSHGKKYLAHNKSTGQDLLSLFRSQNSNVHITRMHIYTYLYTFSCIIETGTLLRNRKSSFILLRELHI